MFSWVSPSVPADLFEAGKALPGQVKTNRYISDFKKTPMNIILGFLFFALFLCAVILGASRNPKAKEIVNEKAVKTIGFYALGIIALIIVISIIRSNSN
jgi:preprotein translocase subunit Sss1